jgi:hypothetical protein
MAKDSLAVNSVPSVSALEDNIVVRKDELLATKTIEVIAVGTVVNHANAKDSLLQKVSGIKDDKNTIKQMLNIELWQSPLNYKGYKMSKYKITLYGIASVETLKIYTLDDVIYLKNGLMFYKLENANEFKPYERFTDETVINKLK